MSRDGQEQRDRSASPEVLLPDEIAHEWVKGWVRRDEVSDPGVAILLVARENGDGVPAANLRAVPVLMREESEVEAKINGHEFPLWVECTERARSPERFWRVEHA